jgi:hypothetical protein
MPEEHEGGGGGAKGVGESGGGLLDVEPGKGKTVMALNIISKLICQFLFKILRN